MPVTVAIPKEITPGETRIALVPEVAGRLVKSGYAVRVERGAGAGARTTDAAFEGAGCRVVDGADLYGGADVVVKVRPPLAAEVSRYPEGALFIGFLQPATDQESVRALAARGLRALSMTLVPRITRAQPMDALSSQATVAGYQAALIGARSLPRFFPMLVTAAGTLPPATVLVLGAGVAGLQAIATARRLGASVRAYDVRPEVKEQVESLGAQFVAAEATSARLSTSSGYAAEAGEEERRRQQAALAKHVAEADCVISTAAIPGKRAPVIVTAEMVRAMKPGSVIVDVAAESGGNCELTQPGQTVVTENAVTILGPLNLAAEMPFHASQMYSRNVAAVLQLITRDGAIALDLEDPIVQGMLVKGGND